MFKKVKNDLLDQEELSYKLKCSQLSSDLEIKDIEISSLNKKLTLSNNELNESECLTKKRLIEDKRKLEAEIETLKFNSTNNTENIELKTANAKIKSEIEVIKSENSHLKLLLKTYQEMPDIKRMLENLSSIAVPNIDDLKSFATAMNDTGIKELIRVVEENTIATKDIVNRSFRGYR